MAELLQGRRSRVADVVADLRFRGRNRRYRTIFEPLGTLSLGDVVDVGGGRLSELRVVHALPADSWTVVEFDPARLPEAGGRERRLIGDGVSLPLRDASYDTTLSIQVLEHVFEPFEMLRELVRVTKPSGHLMLVVPQTANVHEAPHHYQNFTRWWLDEAARRLDLEVVEYRALGGGWSSIASRSALQWLTVFRVDGHHDPRVRRGAGFWFRAPFAAVATAVLVPIALLLSLADVEEEANNHLMVLRRRA